VDIAVCEVRDARISGPELCRKIRASAKNYTYIVIPTSNSEKEHLVEGLGAGAVGKPVATRRKSNSLALPGGSTRQVRPFRQLVIET
jgi:DNA-binding response OmpR family regulator